VAAVGLCLLAVVLRHPVPAILSLWPWLAAFVRLLRWRREKPFRATFTETGLEVEDPPLSLSFTQVQGLSAGRRPVNPYQVGPGAYPIQVIHPGGVVRFPPRLNVRSDEIYGFLYQKLSSRSDGGDIHPTLVPYQRYKEQEYGPARVWSYRARRYQGRGPSYPFLTPLSFAGVLAGLVWLLIGILQQEPGWLGGGVLTLIIAGVFSLALLTQGRLVTVATRYRRSSLVICPDGLALVQADMQGQLRWDEIRDVQVKKRAGAAANSFQWSAGPAGPGIVIRVAGAQIVIADIFDRPLPLIHQLLCHYWRGQTGQQGPAKDWQFDAALLQAAGAFWGDEIAPRGRSTAVNKAPSSDR
jgi:hypothetical protein